jgi:hypothetical protein
LILPNHYRATHNAVANDESRHPEGHRTSIHPRNAWGALCTVSIGVLAPGPEREIEESTMIRCVQVSVPPWLNLAYARSILALHLVVGLLFVLVGIPAQAESDTTVLIIRHGEKPAKGLGQLNCRGLNRALALPAVILSRYGKPQAVYAPNPAVLKTDSGIPYAYVRPLATIEPLAIRVGIPVQVAGGMTEIEPLADRIFSGLSGIHLVAWEHHWAESLARLLLTRLGGDSGLVPRWEEADFDSIYVIRWRKDTTGKTVVSFSLEQQGLNTLPESCDDTHPVQRP